MLAATPNESRPPSLVPAQTCHHFSLDQILLATQDFNQELVIGRGGFGKVYKGHINPGSDTAVAIKRLHSMSDQGSREFQAEVLTLSKLRHCNLVSLIGYCNEGKEMILVYEYMPHGTLEDCLHKAVVPLSWLQRLKICIGAARGLDYLHTGTGTQHGVIHRDVKSSNVLLDEIFAAKISDFGLAKIGPTNQTFTYVSTGVKGTFGYMDPSYFYTGHLTRKSDVYSFGVMLLEVICGRRAVDPTLDEEQWGLAVWAQERIKEGKLNHITDSALKGQITSKCLRQFANIACRCLHNQPKQRPTMAEIITRLELILSSQQKLESSAADGNYINKFWWFFPARVQLKSRKGASSKDEPIDKAANSSTGRAEVDSGSNFPTKVQLKSSTVANSKGEPSDKAANSPTVSSGGAEVYSGSNVSENLIHFDDSSFTLQEVLGASAEVLSRSDYWADYRIFMEDSEQLLVRRIRRVLANEGVQGMVLSVGKLSHANILVPKAYYRDNHETFFVFGYMQNGSISSFLRGSEGQLTKPLGWSTRRSIIVGMTRGLAYLHTQENMVHGFLTSRDVLLDLNYNPVIDDVGLLLLFSDDAGSPKSSIGHAPELLKFKDANMKTDVYGLGLIMLELLTRKSEIEGFDLVGWVKSVPMEEVFDPELENSNTKQELVGILDIAMRCVSVSPDARPETEQVLQQLEEVVAIVNQ